MDKETTNDLPRRALLLGWVANILLTLILVTIGILSGSEALVYVALSWFLGLTLMIWIIGAHLDVYKD